MSAEKQQLVDEHESGRRSLSEEKRRSLQRQLSALQSKVKQLDSTTGQQKKEELEEVRDSLASEHKMDYIDFGATGL